MTTADTGLPGRPNTSFGPRVPNQIGLPGFSATRQNRSSTPSVVSAGLTWSCGPTDTPPETATTSASSSAPARIASVAAAIVGHLPRRAPPRRRSAAASAASATTLRLWIWPGPRSAPGATSSSPGGKHRHPRTRARTARRPGPPRRPRRARPGRARVPALSAAPTARAGPPRRRGCWRAVPHRSRGRPRRPRSWTCSTRDHASAPAGTGGAGRDADRLAVADGGGRAGRPACDSSTTRSTRPAGTGPHGVAVHRGVGEPRDVAARADVLAPARGPRLPPAPPSSVSSGAWPRPPRPAGRFRGRAEGFFAHSDHSLAPLRAVSPHAAMIAAMQERRAPGRPRPVADPVVDAVAARPDEVARRWLLALLEAAPLDAATKVPVDPRPRRTGRRFCAAVLTLVSSDDALSARSSPPRSAGQS